MVFVINYFYFIHILISDDAGDLSKKIYALDMSLKWATVNTELPEEREMHCQVGYLIIS